LGASGEGLEFVAGAFELCDAVVDLAEALVEGE
jgi:hypothetical protein